MNQKLYKIATTFLFALMIVAAISFPTKVNAARSSGSYPTQKGTILVTPDAYKNLISTGHAAIVWDRSKVIESTSKGVQWGNNNWKTTKKKVYGVAVKSTSKAQDQKAAEYCKKQIGKKYNYNYLDMGTRKKFYCSQLVWAAFKDLYRIDLNTSQYTMKAVHPMELVSTDKTKTIYTYFK